MKIKPNYVNPTVAERSFHELLHDLNDLGIDRDEFVRMFRDLTQHAHPAKENKNLFELAQVFAQHKRVTVVHDVLRNPMTQKQWDAETRHYKLKLRYQESFDAVAIPLTTVNEITNARLVISPSAGLMEIQVRYYNLPHWSCTLTDGKHFADHFRAVMFNVPNHQK
jgi:hypothetical protein